VNASYMLRACNADGCVDSASVDVLALVGGVGDVEPAIDDLEALA
jgi:hypothetical protein